MEPEGSSPLSQALYKYWYSYLNTIVLNNHNLQELIKRSLKNKNMTVIARLQKCSKPTLFQCLTAGLHSAINHLRYISVQTQLITLLS
jgi:vacuolar-type H+-ATPase subunit C/Vma6